MDGGRDGGANTQVLIKYLDDAKNYEHVVKKVVLCLVVVAQNSILMIEV
jgi:hypothetical protein